MASFAFYIGFAAGILTSIAALPQLIKLIRDKRADDISIGMFVVLLAGLALWVWYGILQSDQPLIWTNTFSFLVNTAVVGLSVKYKKRRDQN